MITTTPLLQRLPVLMPLSVAAFILTVAGAPSHAPSVAVIVDGGPITDYDIEPRNKLDFLSSHRKLTRKR